MLYILVAFFTLFFSNIICADETNVPVSETGSYGTVNSYYFNRLLNTLDNSKSTLPYSTLPEPADFRKSHSGQHRSIFRLKDSLAYFRLGGNAVQNTAVDFNGRFYYHLRLTPTAEFSFNNTLFIYCDGTLFTKTDREQYNIFSEKQILNTYEYPRIKAVDHAKIGKIGFFDAFQKRAYCELKINGWSVKTGLDNMRWGPGIYQAMLVSGNAGSMFFPYLIQKNLFNRFRATCFTAMRDTDKQRQISAHRIEWLVKPWLRLGASEAAVNSGISSFLTYLNPVQIFYLTNQRSDNKTNLLATADITVKPVKGLAVSAEILNDDIVLFTEDQPSQWGWLANAVYYGQFKETRFWIRTEYIYANVYAYTHYTHENAASIDGFPLGFSSGPDADKFHVEAGIKTGKAEYNIYSSLSRKGSGNIDKPWEDNMPEYRDLPYITGEISNALRFKAGVKRQWNSIVSGGFSINLLRTWEKFGNAEITVMPEIYLSEKF